MPNSVDEILDALSPRELTALEAELDKRAEEDSRTALFASGAKLAQDCLASLQEGELHPALALCLGKEAAGFQKLAPKAKAKVEANKANPPGPAGGPGHGSAKVSGDEVDAALAKLSAAELAGLEKELDAVLEKRAAEEFARKYAEIGVEFARGMFGNEKEAARGAKPGLLGLFEMGLKGTKAPKGMTGATGYRAGKWMKENPGKATLGGIGAGFLGARVLDRD